MNREPEVISIRLECDSADRAFIENLNPRLIDAIDAPTHSVNEVKAFQAAFTATASDQTGTKNVTFIAVDQDGMRIGYVNIREGLDDILREPVGYIALLTVEQAYEGKGVARALIERAEKWAIQAGYRRVYLDVFASNDRAIEFYKREGFEAESIRMVRTVS